ncbi:hypothetical protein [Clostridium sp.]|uniref:hypothetical protein n=1 Tax=Clostridium sp. TaxID=1506 RepID=UPI001B4F751B|nr:hypothetical protein [Clostridium sp.]MBP3916592.1 hypothetical protein [Clostridium sp.]
MYIDREKVKKNKKFMKKNKERKITYKGIIIVLIFSSMLKIGIDSYIYNLNEKYNDVLDEISVEEAEAENLQLQISKAGNLPNLMDTAKNELKMKFPEDKETIYLDMSTEYFPE